MAIYPREDARTALPQLEKSLNTKIDNLANGLVDMFYPVGSYYETSDTDFDPNKKWGGVWELETEGQVHISSVANYAIDGALDNTTDGGSADAIVPYHTHGFTNPTVPNHQHTLTYNGDSGSAASGSDPSDRGHFVRRTTSTSALSTWYTNSTGTCTTTGGGVGYAGTSGNEVGANMQPYIIVNRWHRTA